ncbi:MULTISPECIES: hypothetical protein [unclassified Bradyrhizobium]
MRKPKEMPSKSAFSIAEFCADHSISRFLLQDLIEAGRGPKIMRVGRRVLISAEAARAWRKRMESESAA